MQSARVSHTTALRAAAAGPTGGQEEVRRTEEVSSSALKATGVERARKVLDQNVRSITCTNS